MYTVALSGCVGRREGREGRGKEEKRRDEERYEKRGKKKKKCWGEKELNTKKYATEEKTFDSL